MVDQTALPPSEAPAAPDLEAIQGRTRPDALQGLDDAGLAALLRDLRAQKAAAGDAGVQKALAQAIRRAVAEKRQRQGDDPGPAAARRLEKAAAKAGKAEEKARKEAERAERKRVKEAERAEKKAAKAARKEGAGKLSETRDKQREKKLARLGAPKAGRVKPAPVEGELQAEAKAKPAKDKTAKDKPAKDRLGKDGPGKDRPARAQKDGAQRQKPARDKPGRGDKARAAGGQAAEPAQVLAAGAGDDDRQS